MIIERGLDMKRFWNETSTKLGKMDFLILAIIILFAGIIGFHNLGDKKMPKTYLEFPEKATIMLNFDAGTPISKLRVFSGSVPGEYNIYLSEDGENYEIYTTWDSTYSFTWEDLTINKPSIKSIMVEANTPGSTLGDIQFYNMDNQKIAVQVDAANGALIDELSLVPEKISYMNSMYFDEIYFARSAYEYANHKTVYEWVHPPLGKLIQALPIKLFGMSPFNYRAMGVLAGILLIPLMYAFAKELFGKRKYAILAALLMGLDNFRLVQSRMGTIDTHLVLFILAAFYFMYRYTKQDGRVALKKKLINLGLSGFFIGCAIATKWTGLFGGLGLAILFFTHFIRSKRKDGLKILGYCALFFVLVPSIIYLLSYFVFPYTQPYAVHSLKDFFLQMESMFHYHSGLEAGHSFASKWYTWPLLVKPIWYHVAYLTDATRITISGIGNPMIWWFGVIAMGYLVASFIERRTKEKYTLLVAIITLWLPYMFIGRVMFLYHFFPALPFVMLSIVELIKEFTERKETDKFIWIYLLIVLIGFLLFYPVTSGMVISNDYLKWITWATSWVF